MLTHTVIVAWSSCDEPHGPRFTLSPHSRPTSYETLHSRWEQSPVECPVVASQSVTLLIDMCPIRNGFGALAMSR